MKTKKRIAILGSTGSIGVNTLKVIALHKDRFSVTALTAMSNEKLLREQAGIFKPQVTCLGNDIDVLCDIVSRKDVDVVVLAIRGAAALQPFLAAVRAGKVIAPANKEALVIAGDIIMAQARKYHSTIIPVDSEQSAIFQCLDGQKAPLSKVHLTASGGPLWNKPIKAFGRISVEDILRHPRWQMGAKITVDSATLMNKGFEFIEAMRLFNLSPEQIKVVVHPQAIIHSMVEFADGSILAQLGVTDMRLPIQYALSYPQRLDTGIKPLDFPKTARLEFFDVDQQKFPSLALAIAAARKGGTVPCVLNAADEVAVEAFLNGQLRFTDIYEVVARVMARHKMTASPTLGDILETDAWARSSAQAILGKLRLCR